jgi:oligoribonuclease
MAVNLTTTWSDDWDIEDWAEANQLPLGGESSSIELIWCDLETTGLSKKGEDRTMEVGLVTTDKYGRVMDAFQRYVFDAARWHHSLTAMTEYVKKMHGETGLMQDYYAYMDALDPANPSMSPDSVTEDAIGWLADQGINVSDADYQLPMAGSTVDFDRRLLLQDLPNLEAAFHYRSINVSTTKLQCKMLNPTVFSKMEDARTIKGLPQHRVLNDIGASIREYRFYIDNFLWVA